MSKKKVTVEEITDMAIIEVQGDVTVDAPHSEGRSKNIRDAAELLKHRNESKKLDIQQAELDQKKEEFEYKKERDIVEDKQKRRGKVLEFVGNVCKGVLVLAGSFVLIAAEKNTDYYNSTSVGKIVEKTMFANFGKKN